MNLFVDMGFNETVIFKCGKFRAEAKLEDTGYMYADLPDGTKHFIQDKSVYMDWCEIIGNIYENPELMENK